MDLGRDDGEDNAMVDESSTEKAKRVEQHQPLRPQCPNLCAMMMMMMMMMMAIIASNACVYAQ